VAVVATRVGVVSIEEYRRLTSDKPAFKQFLLAAPDLGALELERSSQRARTVELGPQ
jgi:hypothetical protein